MLVEVNKVEKDIKTLRDALQRRDSTGVNRWFAKHTQNRLVTIDEIDFESLRIAGDIHSENLLEVVITIIRNL
jgi:hypothetical protein